MKIARRSTLLFLLGIFLNGFPDFSWATIRIPGVLQRIAVVYFLSANFYLFLPRLFILILFIFLIFIHWFIVTQIPLPGMSETSLEIGKNISGWIDYYLMPNHLWIHSKTWDPEGILGTLTATASCLSGLLYGSIFSKEKKLTGYQYYLGIFMGILLISLSLVWSIVFPINKSLWTGSYVLLNTGLAIIVFHLLYENIDEAGARSWYYGFEVLGVNALTAFFLSSLFSKILNIPLVYNVSGKQVGIKSFLYSNYFTPFFSSYNASFFWALGYSFLWVLFFGILYKKKIFIKL